MVVLSTVRVHSGHLSESWSALCGHQLVRQAANLTYGSTCRLLWAEHAVGQTVTHFHLYYYCTVM